jgi:hypothetical protein
MMAGRRVDRLNIHAQLAQDFLVDQICGDILGDACGIVIEEIYCDPIALAGMLEHLRKLPIVTAHLEPRPINLIPWVAEKSRTPLARKFA